MNQEEMAVKLVEVDARSKSNTHRLDELGDKVDVLTRLTTAVEVMAAEQKHQGDTINRIEADVDSIGRKVDTIEKKPAKRWDGLVDKFLCGLVGALASALFAGMVYLLTVAA